MVFYRTGWISFGARRSRSFTTLECSRRCWKTRMVNNTRTPHACTRTLSTIVSRKNHEGGERGRKEERNESFETLSRERGGEERRCPATGQSHQASASISGPLDQSDPGQVVSRRGGDRFRKLEADIQTELGLPPALQETVRRGGSPWASVLGRSESGAGGETKVREIRAAFHGGDVESGETDEAGRQLGILRLPLLLQSDAESAERPMRSDHHAGER